MALAPLAIPFVVGGAGGGIGPATLSRASAGGGEGRSVPVLDARRLADELPSDDDDPMEVSTWKLFMERREPGSTRVRCRELSTRDALGSWWAGLLGGEVAALAGRLTAGRGGEVDTPRVRGSRNMRRKGPVRMLLAFGRSSGLSFMQLLTISLSADEKNGGRAVLASRKHCALQSRKFVPAPPVLDAPALLISPCEAICFIVVPEPSVHPGWWRE
mmetsp:Transcript_46395/g.122998  ORF Transcript_46395/g.122998 Transcript_46395/m.122998 type:complete len:216 (+) Transcript_46395:232-879(+)